MNQWLAVGYADAQAISAGYMVPVGTVYRWASLDHWQRMHWAGRVLYRIADVDTTYTRINTREGYLT